MKILKYLFFLLLIVFIGGAIYFATKDGNYDIQESTIVEAPIELVFDKVNEYKTWENWGPWKKEDPTMVFNYSDKTTGEGASYSWNGEEGDGSMRTIQVVPNQLIRQELTLQTPAGERKPDVYWEFKEVEGGTQVTWGVRGEHQLMDKAYFTLTSTDFEKQMRDMYAAGLSGLKQSVLDDMEVYAVEVNGLTQYSGGFYMYTTAAVNQSALSDKMATMFGTVMQFMNSNNIPQAGMPMTIYNEMDNQNGSFIISCAIPVSSRIITPADSDVLCGFMPAQTAIKTTLRGDYKNLGEAWGKAEAYIAKNNYTKSDDGVPFELYVTDPGEYPNPANWITEIFIPVNVDETP